MVQVNFLARAFKLEVNFRDLSPAIQGAQYSWDFGDKSPFSSERAPVHTFPTSGVYSVTLDVKDHSGEVLGSFTKDVLVSEYVDSVLPDTIYKLIDTYIPTEVFGELSFSMKQQLIGKWQLYIGDLVNHHIPKREKDNELFYEALENQLIMQLAAYDFVVLQITNLLNSQSKKIQTTGITDPNDPNVEVEGGNVKKIITGPTEVEYFNEGEADSNLVKYAFDALKPGGLVDTLKSGICMLAERLDIYLPFCNRRSKDVVVPRVVDRRHPGPLDGPDPYGILI